MDEFDMKVASAVLKDLSDAEWDFLEEYRKSEAYMKALSEWNAKRTWRVSVEREVIDGRNVLLIEQCHGIRTMARVVVEAADLDHFIERALECAERVRAAEQQRLQGKDK